MSEEDPLAELSSAAKKRYVPGRVPRAVIPGHGVRAVPYRPGKTKSTSYVVPIVIGLGLLGAGVTAAIIIMPKLLEPPPPPPKTTVIIQETPRGPQQGELYKSVKSQDPAKPVQAQEPARPVQPQEPAKPTPPPEE
jgi:hypothetical protein